MLDRARPLPGIAALLDTFDEMVSQGTMMQAVASFYVYEAQVPEISTQKISGLRRFYNITEPEALAYFGVHEEADVRHRAAWRTWLAGQDSSDSFGVICAAQRRSLKALWGGLDAVYPPANSCEEIELGGYQGTAGSSGGRNTARTAFGKKPQGLPNLTDREK